MKLSKEIISKIIDWYEEYVDSDNPNNMSAEQYISNKLSWEEPEPIDEDKLDELALNYFNKQWSTSYKSLSEIVDDLDLCAIEDFKAGYRKAMEK